MVALQNPVITKVMAVQQKYFSFMLLRNVVFQKKRFLQKTMVIHLRVFSSVGVVASIPNRNNGLKQLAGKRDTTS